MAAQQLQPREVKIRVHDGVEIGVAIYAPEGQRPFPGAARRIALPLRQQRASRRPAVPLARDRADRVLCQARLRLRPHGRARLAASPAATSSFLGPNEQSDLYDVIEWIAHQPWSNGKVGGIGQSYFCMSQWWMAHHEAAGARVPRRLRRLERSLPRPCYHRRHPGPVHSAATGGTRTASSTAFRRTAQQPREQETDLDPLIQRASDLRRFLARALRRRAAARDQVPLYSVGIWGKVDLHTRGNIDGFRRASGPRKLQMRGPINALAPNARVQQRRAPREGAAAVLRPLPEGQAHRMGEAARRWSTSCAAPTLSGPPRPGRRPGVKYKTWHLERPENRQRHFAQRRRSHAAIAAGRARATSYTLSQSRLGERRGRLRPDGPRPRPGAARADVHHRAAREDLEIAGPIKLVALRVIDARRHGLLRQALRAVCRSRAEDRAKGLNPRAFRSPRAGCAPRIARSIRARAPRWSRTTRTRDPQPLKPGEVYRFEISIEPKAHRFKQGNRIRLEIVNGDSADHRCAVDALLQPNKIGTDTIHHSAEHPSALTLPVMEGV